MRFSAESANTLELAFESETLRTICEIEAQAKRELGSAVAETLKHRLADLRAAKSVRDLPVGQPHALGDRDREEMIIELCDGFGLVFKSNHTQRPSIGGDDIDWTRVTRVKILRIEGYYHA
jgi:hypothetical protein